MKTLFITRHYLDEMLGGPNCSTAFVRAVASICPDTTLIYPEHNDRKSNLYFLKEYDGLKLLPVYDKRSKWQKCLDMYRGRLHRFGHIGNTAARYVCNRQEGTCGLHKGGGHMDCRMDSACIAVLRVPVVSWRYGAWHREFQRPADRSLTLCCPSETRPQ